MAIRGYKLTHDSGFAPNPFHGCLTLATCRPPVRRCRKPGDWIAGFASQQLVVRARQNGVTIPFMGLIYLAKVSEVIPLASYFEDQRFALKKPKKGSPHEIERAGDNIYFQNAQGHYRQLPNDHHLPGDMDHDLGGVNSLICKDFWYLGRKAIVPEGGWGSILGSQDIGSARLFALPADFKDSMLAIFHANGIKPGVNADPCLWKNPASPRSSCGARRAA
ncbi:hypothetical protein PE066_19030 [Ramlibacter tataouinensis]|uniref:Nmad2 family putative nucleotide modification protein n=1 Tax=Ramlibacter tataouinensis TaxID=94132 RepID=UPI0022F3C0B1|nr:hypothetical protein [Ramlibacter tataouinensis]WBY01532.1 hypothetical protein PE066_19030 [Ramlibacter tataouinensis]